MSQKKENVLELKLVTLSRSLFQQMDETTMDHLGQKFSFDWSAVDKWLQESAVGYVCVPSRGEATPGIYLILKAPNGALTLRISESSNIEWLGPKYKWVGSLPHIFLR